MNQPDLLGNAVSCCVHMSCVDSFQGPSFAGVLPCLSSRLLRYYDNWPTSPCRTPSGIIVSSSNANAMANAYRAHLCVPPLPHRTNNTSKEATDASLNITTTTTHYHRTTSTSMAVHAASSEFPHSSLSMRRLVCVKGAAYANKLRNMEK